MSGAVLKPLVDGLVFGEAPRWHDGRLWFSDIADRRICSVDPAGDLREEHAVDFTPSGLGWLPDGRLLVTSMLDHRLMRFDGDGFTPVADLSAHCGGKLNDMVVDARGRAYIGNIGFELEADPIEPRTTTLVRVDPDASVHAVAEDVMCPNGMAITADGSTLLVGQSGTTELLAFDIADNGDLSGRRVYARIPDGATFDGLCVDADAAVWFASPISNEFLRVLAGGEITHRIDTGDRPAIACMLGGEDRRTLFAITSWTMSIEQSKKKRGGEIATAEVAVPGAGWP